jgi:hypothetical protein
MSAFFKTLTVREPVRSFARAEGPTLEKQYTVNDGDNRTKVLPERRA